MNQSTMTVRLSGTLNDFVAYNVGDDGDYENVSEYVRNLIRQDKNKVEKERLKTLKAELALAFSADESEYVSLSAQDIFERNK